MTRGRRGLASSTGCSGAVCGRTGTHLWGDLGLLAPRFAGWPRPAMALFVLEQGCLPMP